MLISQTQLSLPVYGHGLSNDEAPPIALGDKNVTVAVKMTPAFIVDSINDAKIQIRLKDAKTDATIPHATFLVTIDKDNKVLLSEQFHAHDGELFLSIKPTNTDSPMISADKEPLGWIGSKDSPASAEAPIYLDGGLYHYKIEVLTLERDDNLLDPPLVFDAYVSVGEEAKHPATGNGVQYDFGTRTYFDKIADFRFDDSTNIIQFTMPLNWDKNFLSQIPLLHIEVLIPKSVSQLMISSYKGTLNGVELPRNAIMVDDSPPDTRIVHYMIPGNRLTTIADQAKITPETSTAVFTLEPRPVPVFPLETLTNKEKFKIQLSWSPAIIEPEQSVKFIFNIRDPKTDEPLRNSYYEFVLVKDGKEIYRNSKTAVIGGEFEQFTFTEEHAGNVVARFENINHTGEFTEYLISVVGEVQSAGPTVPSQPKPEPQPPQAKQLDVSVNLKQTKKLTLIAVKNNEGTPIFGVKLKMSDANIKFVKAKGWDRDRVDQNTVMVGVQDKPLLPGRPLIIMLLSSNPNSSVEWSVLDKNGERLGSGVLEPRIK